MSNSTVGDILDKSALVDFANEKFFAKQSKLSLFQITCMYWIYSSIGSYWNEEILLRMEQETIEHVRAEIKLQKELERNRDDKTDEKLLSVSLTDL